MRSGIVRTENRFTLAEASYNYVETIVLIFDDSRKTNHSEIIIIRIRKKLLHFSS